MVKTNRNKEKENQSTFVLQYIYFRILQNLIEKILVSIMVICVYISVLQSFAYCFLPLIVIETICFVVNLYFHFKYSGLSDQIKESFKYSATYNLQEIYLYLFIFLFTKNWLGRLAFFILIMVYCGVSLLMIFVSKEEFYRFFNQPLICFLYTS